MATTKRNKLNFSTAKILVIGDIMLDQYIKGVASRISPEAPVPVVLHTKTENNLGGAANVAVNLARLGCQTTLLGLVGQDVEAQIVNELAVQEKLEGVALSTEFPTITKTRIVAHHQQIVRLDREEFFALGKKDFQHYLQIAEALIPLHDAVIISDYAKGTISKALMQAILKLAKKHKTLIFVDPKQNDWKYYGAVDFITPNFGEFKSAIQKNIENENAFIEKEGKAILKKTGIRHVLVTRSDKGMSFVSAKENVHLEANAREVFDVSGAGDTVIATFTAGITLKMPIQEAVKLANIAAGIVVGKEGTTPISLKELEEAWIKK